jgi:hypothetical protein
MRFVEVAHLSVVLSGRVLLHDVSFRVGEGREGGPVGVDYPPEGSSQPGPGIPAGCAYRPVPLSSEEDG